MTRHVMLQAAKPREGPGLQESISSPIAMETIAIEDIQRDPDGVLHRIKAGETLLIVQNNEPVAELKPVESPGKELRPFGLCAGAFSVPEDFDAPLPGHVTRLFEGP